MKRFSSLIASLLVLLLIIIIAGVLYGSQRVFRANENRTAQGQEAVEPVTATEETKEWPSWRSETAGVAFRYPSEWVVTEDAEGIQVNAPAEYRVKIEVRPNDIELTAFAYFQHDWTVNPEIRYTARGYRHYLRNDLAGYEVFRQNAEGSLDETIYFTKGKRAYVVSFPLGGEGEKSVEYNEAAHKLLGTLEL